MSNVPAATSRIVIVDDEPVNVRLLEMLLQQEGYTQVASTTDPRTALALCTEFQPDLILLDIQMPGLDGFQILEQLRPIRGPGTYLPVLVLTADSTAATRQRALMLGANDVLTKLVDPSNVLLCIRTLLLTREAHRAAQSAGENHDPHNTARTCEPDMNG
jgi:CheY-like chemotaxis protein